jgi:hypothetical protein
MNEVSDACHGSTPRQPSFEGEASPAHLLVSDGGKGVKLARKERASRAAPASSVGGSGGGSAAPSLLYTERVSGNQDGPSPFAMAARYTPVISRLYSTS